MRQELERRTMTRTGWRWYWRHVRLNRPVHRPDPDWKRQLSQWEACTLDGTGRWIAGDWTMYGFPYAPGDWVPIDRRYSAMLAHRWAERTAFLSEFRVSVGTYRCAG